MLFHGSLNLASQKILPMDIDRNIMSGQSTPTSGNNAQEQDKLNTEAAAEGAAVEDVETIATSDSAANQSYSANDAASESDEVFTTPNSSPPLSAFDAAGRVKTLQLHSPSNIVGTPFTGESSSTSSASTRFEYPFPSSSLSSPSNSPPGSSLSSVHPSHHASPPPPTLELPYTPAHPKLRTNPPPIPPGLLKKKRWSLTAGFLPLLQRRASRGSQSSSTSSSSQALTTTSSPKQSTHRPEMNDGDNP